MLSNRMMLDADYLFGPGDDAVLHLIAETAPAYVSGGFDGGATAREIPPAQLGMSRRNHMRRLETSDEEKRRLAVAIREMQRLAAPPIAWTPLRAVAEAQVETLYWV